MRGTVLVLLSCACACAGDGADGGDGVDPGPGLDPSTLDPTALGPYQAGYTAWDHTYTTAAGIERTVKLGLWYPTEATEGADVAYGPEGAFADPLALGDAAPAPPIHEGGYPVLAYTHGDRGFGGTSAFLMRWFASHGWVAVAPDHTDNLLWANDDPTPASHWYDRPTDVSEAVSALDDLDAGVLGGPVDTASYVVAGHSRGGSTVWSLAGAAFDPADAETWCPGCTEDERALFDGGLEDARADAFVLLASGYREGLLAADGWEAARGPFLAVTGSEDPQGWDTRFDALDPLPLTWVDLAGGCHQTPALGVPCGTLDAETGFGIVGAHVLAFARAVHLGDDGPAVTAVVTGDDPVDAAVVSHRRRE